jgi:holo-ACP synthase
MELKAILQAREKRWEARRRLAARHRCPVLTLRLNIPGPNKNLPGVEQCLEILRASLPELPDWPGAAHVAEELMLAGCDGPHRHLAVRLPALRLKRTAVGLEEEHRLGRLLDADVMDEHGEPVGRAELGLAPRKCFLCAEEAAVCRRAGRHSLDDLLQHVRLLLDAV